MVFCYGDHVFSYVHERGRMDIGVLLHVEKLEFVGQFLICGLFIQCEI